MTAIATLSGKFQISIPKAIRDEQRWHAGQESAFIPKGNRVLLMPVPEFEQLFGIAKGANTRSIRDRNVVLTDHQSSLLEKLVAGGRYRNASEVLREGLRLVEHKEMEDKLRLKALREAARVGIADADAGRFKQFTEAGELRRHLTKVTEAALRVGLASPAAE
jgi:antitoxin ParD1/3/4